MKKLTQEDFILRSKKVFGDRYDYSLAIYKGINIKVKIICPIHGEFMQTPYSHMAGHACPKCAENARTEKKYKSKTYFLKEFNKLYNNKYDYSKMKYPLSNDGKIEIICSIHGSFMMTCNNHMRGHGCPYCSKKRTKKRRFYKESK